MAKSKKPKKLKPGRTHFQFSKEQRISIVGEIQSGKLTRKEAKEKYKITGHGTLNSWLLRYGSNTEGVIRKQYNRADQRLTAYKVVTGELTVDEAARAMQVGREAVSNWVRTYRNDIHQHSVPAVASPPPKQLGKSNKIQQKALNELKLKVASLEMMIDIAEKDLKIDIRKKSGTKQ
jgi:transposase